MPLPSKNAVTFWHFLSKLHKFCLQSHRYGNFLPEHALQNPESRIPKETFRKKFPEEKFLAQNQLRAAIDTSVIAQLRQSEGRLLRGLFVDLNAQGL